MSVTTSYEVYQKHHDDWVILFVHPDREEALEWARKYIQRKSSSIVQVIEERLDDVTQETRSTIIFHDGLAKPHKEPDEVRRPRRRPPPKKEHRVSAFIRSAIIIVLSVCGITTAALIGLAMVVDLFQ